MRQQRVFHFFAAALLVWGLGLGTAEAGTTTWVGTNGNMNAQATITTGANSLSIVLSNLADPSVFKQGLAVSDLSIVFNGASLTLPVNGVSGTGQLGNINGGVVAYVDANNNPFTGNSALTRWPANSAASGTTFHLNAIGGGQPDHMIAPSIANGGTFPSGPGSQFNPYVIGSATFTVNLTGVTASMTPDSVTFSFGTTPDGYANGVQVAVPEPSSLVLAGLGGLGMLGMARRARRP